MQVSLWALALWICQQVPLGLVQDMVSQDPWVLLRAIALPVSQKLDNTLDHVQECGCETRGEQQVGPLCLSPRQGRGAECSLSGTSAMMHVRECYVSTPPRTTAPPRRRGWRRQDIGESFPDPGCSLLQWQHRDKINQQGCNGMSFILGLWLAHWWEIASGLVLFVPGPIW